MTRTEYHRHPALNASQLKAASHGVRNWLRYLANPPNGYELRLGTALHMMVEDFPGALARIIPGPAKTVTARAWVEAEAALPEGFVMLTPEDITTRLPAMHAALRGHPLAALHLAGVAEREVPMFFERRGHQCKALIDGLGSDYFVDLKTTRARSLKQLRWQIRDLRYDIQAAWYREATGGKQPVFVFVESEELHPEVYVYEFSDAELDLALADADRAADAIAAYRKTGYVPFSYPEAITEEDQEVSEMFSNEEEL